MTSKGAEAQERDRVSQVYLGLLDVGPTGAWLRCRIDWMVDEAHGPRVLDVGCSEGILEVLLARRGIKVTGIDKDDDAIEFAQELLAKEPDEVRRRVTFVHGDFIGTHQATGLFDTVVMGELLEYAGDPAAMLDRGLEYLRPGGRLIVTTPFGVHPHGDQRRIFFLTDLIDLLKPTLKLVQLSVEDNHIRFVGNFVEDQEREGSWRQLDTEAVVSLTNTALLSSQSKLNAMLSMQETQIQRLQQRLNRCVEVERTTQSKLSANNEKLKRIEFRVKLYRVALESLRRRLKARSEHLLRKVRELESRTKELLLTSQRLQSTRASTSFLLGSVLVGAARKPVTLWKVPYQLLVVLRSKQGPQATETLAPETTTASHSSVPEEDSLDFVPEETYADPSQFIDFPLLPIPEARQTGKSVAAILDTFSEYSLRHEVNLLLMSPVHWRTQLEKTRPVFLIVESAWRGNNGGWRNRIVHFEEVEENPLRDLLEYCRTSGIPTVFWNKEDPPHFDNFLGAAREFDFVFTTDADCVPRYKRALGHERVFVLPFAAQPRLHNPSREKGWPNYPVCFAGSWVQRRYPGRAETLRYILDAALPYGLHIFDRNLTRPEFGPDYHFPEQYKQALKGTLTYEEMLTAYRCYDVMLNVNTVTESPTMLSRRVIESLACGTPVISSESVAMTRMLGKHVRVTRDKEETSGHLRELLGDEEARVREGHLAYRHIHENHTYRHRMNEVFRRLGVKPLTSEQPSVSVLMPTMRPENVLRCLDNFKKQTYANKELILILNNAEFDLDAIRKHTDPIPNVRVLHVEERTTLGDCLNRGVEAASGKYVAKMDDDDHYGERYLSDHVLAASFSDAEVVGKGLYFVYFESTNTTAMREAISEHTFTYSATTGGTLFIRSDVCREIPFDSISVKEDTNFQRSAARAGCRLYSADRFNFIRVRMRRLSRHSDPTSDAELREKCRNHTLGLDIGRAMI